MMKVSLEDTSTLGRKLSIIVPAERFVQELKKKKAQLGKHLRMPGFRPGKLPDSVLEKEVGPMAHEEAVTDVVNTSLAEAIDEQKLKIATQPEITQLKAVPGEALEYQATFEVFPKVTLPDFSTLTVQKYQVEIHEEDVEKTLEKVRKQLSTEEDKLAELDEAFAQKLGAESADKEVIHQKIRAQLEQWVNIAIQNHLRQDLIKVLLKAIPLEIPKAVLDTEMAKLHHQHHQKTGGDPNASCAHEGLEDEAIRQVSLGLIIQKILEQEKMILDQERFRHHIAELTKTYSMEVLMQNAREVQNIVLADQALDFVLTKVTMGEKIGTVEELLN